jgi:hypothetical protein
VRDPYDHSRHGCGIASNIQAKRIARFDENPMPPTIPQLHDPAAFDEIANFDHDSTAAIAQKWMSKSTPPTVIYGVSVMAATALLIFNIVSFALDEGKNGFAMTLQIVLGVVIGVPLLLPVHELLHGLAYLLTGARREQVSIKFERKALVAVCYADRFVAARWPFVFIALLPMTVLVSGLWLLGWLFPAQALMFSTAALVHLMLAGGDIAMTNLALSGGARQTYTYDDVGARRTYFFAAKAA